MDNNKNKQDFVTANAQKMLQQVAAGTKRLLRKLNRQLARHNHRKKAHKDLTRKKPAAFTTALQKGKKNTASVGKKVGKKVIKSLVAFGQIIMTFFVTLLPYIVAVIGFMIGLALFASIFSDNEWVHKYLSFNWQEDLNKLENPFNIDRDGNYTTQIKEISKGNKMYFVYYAYNAKRSYYAVTLNENNQPTQFPGTKTLGLFGGRTLLRGDDPAYQKFMKEQHFDDNTKDAIQSFTMNTNMLYLLDTSMHRGESGTGRSGFLYSEQFIKPMYTDENFNYKALQNQKTGTWNAKSWVFDEDYHPRLKKFYVGRQKYDKKDGPLIYNPSSEDIGATTDANGKTSAAKDWHGSREKYYVYQGAQSAAHPYPYRTTDGQAPNTENGNNIQKKGGVWNYGFGSIMKFKEYDVQFAEKIHWPEGIEYKKTLRKKLYYLVGATTPYGTIDLTPLFDKERKKLGPEPNELWPVDDMKRLTDEEKSQANPDGTMATRVKGVDSQGHVITETGSVEVISNAPKIDEDTWKELTSQLVKDYTNGAGQTDLTKNVFKLHGTEYFRQYLKNYSTYVPSNVNGGTSFDLATRFYTFDNGSLFEPDSKKKEAYSQLNKLFAEAIAKGEDTSIGTNSKPGDYTGVGDKQTKWQAAMQWKDLAVKYGQMYGIDPYLIIAIIAHESGGKANISNGSGSSAYGLMQVIADSGTYPHYNFQTKQMENAHITQAAMVNNPDLQVKFGVEKLAYALNDPHMLNNVYLGLMQYADGPAAQRYADKFGAKATPDQIASMPDHYNQQTYPKEVMQYYACGKDPANAKGVPYFITKDGVKHYADGTSDGSGIGGAINGMSNSIMSWAKGLFAALGEGFNSVWGSMFPTVPPAADIYSYVPGTNWQPGDIHYYQGDPYFLEADILRGQQVQPVTGDIADNNIGAKMLSWTSWSNKINQAQFLDIMRAYLGILQTSNNYATNFDQTPQDENQIGYILNHFMTNKFLNLYNPHGALTPEEQTKKVIELAFGKEADAAIIDGKVPAIAAAAGDTNLNKESNDAQATIQSTDKKQPDAGTVKSDQETDYTAYNNLRNPQTTEETANNGSFNGENIMLETKRGQKVQTFAAGKVVGKTENSLVISTKDALATYTNLVPATNLSVGSKIKAKQQIGLTRKQKLLFAIQVPPGYLAQLDVTEKLAKALTFAYPNTLNTDNIKDINETDVVAQEDPQRMGQYINPTVLFADDDTNPTGNWGSPLKGVDIKDLLINSGFGNRGAVAGGTAWHQGWDVQAHDQQEVMAVDDGTVVKVGHFAQIGWLVIIDHKYAMSYYQHMHSNVTVHVGDHVKKGQVIGHVGGEGSGPNDYAPHLHFGAISEEAGKKYLSQAGYPMPPIPKGESYAKKTKNGWLDPAQFYGFSDGQAKEFNRRTTSGGQSMTIKQGLALPK